MLIVGVHRYVVILGDFVAKVPRIRFYLSLHSLRNIHKNPYFFGHEFFRVLLRGLTEGIKENVREALFWHRTHHRLVAPVLLPLVVVNIYPRAKGVGDFRIEGEEIGWKYNFPPDASRSFRKCFMKVDGHTFDNRNNFAHENGHVLILDYGGKGVPELIAAGAHELEDFLTFFAGRTAEYEVKVGKEKAIWELQSAISELRLWSNPLEKGIGQNKKRVRAAEREIEKWRSVLKYKYGMSSADIAKLEEEA